MTMTSPGPTARSNAVVPQHIRHQVDRLGGVLGEHQLVGVGADERGDVGAALLVGVGGLLHQLVRAAVHGAVGCGQERRARRRAPAAAAATSPRNPGTPTGFRRASRASGSGSPPGSSRRPVRTAAAEPSCQAPGRRLREALVAVALRARRPAPDRRTRRSRPPTKTCTNCGLDVAQDAGVVRDQQHAAVLGFGVAVDALADHPQRVDVQAGVGLVEDRDLGLEQRELQDLVALLLAAGEALVDTAFGERRVDVELAPSRP